MTTTNGPLGSDQLMLEVPGPGGTLADYRDPCTNNEVCESPQVPYEPHMRARIACAPAYATTCADLPSTAPVCWDPLLTGPTTVSCPSCGAAPSQPCRNRTGKVSKRLHAARRDELRYQRLLAASRPRIKWADRRAGQLLLIAADENPCPLCGLPIFAPLAHIDHIIPFGIGGVDDLSNLRVICRDCNLGRPRDGSDLDPATLATSRFGRRT